MRVERYADEIEVLLESLDDTRELGRAIARVVRPGTVVGLIGPLGAGKTHLTRAIAEALGADPSAIGSPTFTLIHEYPASLPVFHFDTYRLKSPDEFDDLGASDYWSSGQGVCLVEWADRVWDRLPFDAWWIQLIPESETVRRVRIKSPAADLVEPLLANSDGSA